MNKDYVAVNRYYHENQSTEFMMCYYLNRNMPLELVKQGFFFEIQVNGQYNKNDIRLIRITPERNEKQVVINIEYEYAANQHEWIDELPRNRWQALNLVTRKKYGKTFSLFIKSSTTYKSLFAVDCRDNFVQKNFGNSEVLEHNLSFETNNEFYRIYWNDVAKHTYIDNKENRQLTDGNICIIEHDSANDWKQFYSFLWRRFIKGIHL